MSWTADGMHQYLNFWITDWMSKPYKDEIEVRQFYKKCNEAMLNSGFIMRDIECMMAFLEIYNSEIKRKSHSLHI